jgi:hypothetical protein
MTDPRPTSESELVERIRSIDVRAPDSLHRRVQAMIDGEPAQAGRRTGRWRGAGRSRSSSVLGPRLAAGGAIAAVVVALAIVIGLSGGSSTLSVRDASALTLRPATAAAPEESAGNGRALTAAVDGVSFPYWGGHFGWRSTGSRTDRVDGRTITTVFYANRRGERVGYAIVAGPTPTPMSGGVVSMRDGTSYRLLTVEGVAVVTWLRDGRLCVISGRGVSGATLLTLASWDDHGSVSS